jgi:5-methylthioadenosine/S-adenosylhomocysteine deaminase
MSILIRNGWIVTQDSNRNIVKKDIYIESNKIVEISDKITTEADYKINAKDKIIAPGLINTHTHIAMSLLRGVAEDLNLDSFLDKMFMLDASRKDEDIYLGSLLGMIELIRTGTTSFLDLYYSEDIIAKAALEAGNRAFLGWVVLDKEYTTQKADPLKNAEHFINEFNNKNELIVPEVGLQGIYVCSKETLLKAKELAEKYDKLVTMHIAETRKEIYDHQNKFKLRPVEYLDSIGFLSHRLVSVHSVYLTLNEIYMFAKNQVSVSHNPVSNMKLGNGGAAPIFEMLKNGITVTLGTDSVSSNNNLDMFQVMKTAGLLMKNDRWDASIISAQQILDFATLNGAKALKNDKIGSIEVDKLADLIIIDPIPNGLPMYRENMVPNIIYALEGLNVDTTIINGNILMHDKKLRASKHMLNKLARLSD